jgi:hypothetical protein
MAAAQLLAALALLQALGTAGDLLPANRDSALLDGRAKPITIWPLADAARMHVHSPELAAALPTLLRADIPVIDLGCGVGYYVAELAKKGYEAYGVEGTPDIQGIALHEPIFQADLSEPLTVPLPDGHVLSFEVAEHLAVEDEGTFLDNVVLHARSRLLLSWALPEACAPGRGHGHLNCRSNLYVIRQLFLRGFTFHEDESTWLRERVRGSAAYWFDGTLLVFDRLDLSKLSLHDLAAEGPALHVPEGSRGGIRVADKLPLCSPQVALAEPRPGAVFEVDPGDVADVMLQLSLKHCPSTQRCMACALVFVNGRCWASDGCVVCPRLDESELTLTLYALPTAEYNLTVVPSTTGGVASLALAVRRHFSVVARSGAHTWGQGSSRIAEWRAARRLAQLPADCSCAGGSATPVCRHTAAWLERVHLQDGDEEGAVGEAAQGAAGRLSQWRASQAAGANKAAPVASPAAATAQWSIDTAGGWKRLLMSAQDAAEGVMHAKDAELCQPSDQQVPPHLEAPDVRHVLALPVFVLNLPSKLDRRAHMLCLLASVGFSRIDLPAPVQRERMAPAKAHQLDVMRESEGCNPRDPLSCLACCLSHLGAIELALARGHESFIVLEDDVMLGGSVATVRRRLAAAVADLPASADMLYLEACFEDCPNVRFAAGHLHIAKAHRPLCAAAILLTAKGARKVLAHGKPPWYDCSQGQAIGRSGQQIRCSGKRLDARGMRWKVRGKRMDARGKRFSCFSCPASLFSCPAPCLSSPLFLFLPPVPQMPSHRPRMPGAPPPVSSRRPCVYALPSRLHSVPPRV